MNWEPFDVLPPGARAPSSRSAATLEGRQDRLRSVAFAELQAKAAFLWAADTFTDAPSGLTRTWRALAAAEAKHFDWLVARLHALGGTIDGRPVSDGLWHSLISARSAREFSYKMASAEDRGRAAGEKLMAQLHAHDPETALLFGTIAEEERAHVSSALVHFPDIEQELLAERA